MCMYEKDETTVFMLPKMFYCNYPHRVQINLIRFLVEIGHSIPKVVSVKDIDSKFSLTGRGIGTVGGRVITEGDLS